MSCHYYSDVSLCCGCGFSNFPLFFSFAEAFVFYFVRVMILWSHIPCRRCVSHFVTSRGSLWFRQPKWNPFKLEWTLSIIGHFCKCNFTCTHTIFYGTSWIVFQMRQPRKLTWKESPRPDSCGRLTLVVKRSRPFWRCTLLDMKRHGQMSSIDSARLARHSSFWISVPNLARIAHQNRTLLWNPEIWSLLGHKPVPSMACPYWRLSFWKRWIIARQKILHCSLRCNKTVWIFHWWRGVTTSLRSWMVYWIKHTMPTTKWRQSMLQPVSKASMWLQWLTMQSNSTQTYLVILIMTILKRRVSTMSWIGLEEFCFTRAI